MGERKIATSPRLSRRTTKTRRQSKGCSSGTPWTAKHPEDVHPKCNAPEFLFKEDFNSWRDTPRYRFDNKDDLLHRVKARLKDPALAARIKKMDKIFNMVVVGLAVAYVAVQGLRLAEPGWMPLPLFVIAMVLLRCSLAGFGHYAIHRRQKGLTRLFANAFDINYVALGLVTADGHTLLHHPHTQSEVDIKKNVFTMMMRLPRLLRIPVHTIHKFGHMVTGMPVRILDVVRITRKIGVKEVYGTWRNAIAHIIGSAGLRVLLIGELVAFLLAGEFWAWALQFVATLWVSTFLIVSSHDFEDDSDEELATDNDDWGIHQLDGGSRPEGGRKSLRRLLPVSRPEFAPRRTMCCRISGADSPTLRPKTCCAKRRRDSVSSGFPQRVSSPIDFRSSAAPISCRPPDKRRSNSGGSSANTAHRRLGKPASPTRLPDSPDSVLCELLQPLGDLTNRKEIRIVQGRAAVLPSGALRSGAASTFREASSAS